RESRPSLQVIDALAFVFDFDRDTREHVYRLAGLMPVIALGPSSDEPSTDLLELMHSWPHTPAVLFNRAYDILGHNHSGQALYSALDPERNLFLSV
ncbi:MmyB family transcriptional regulator, partial [Escherichia coli]